MPESGKAQDMEAQRELAKLALKIGVAGGIHRLAPRNLRRNIFGRVNGANQVPDFIREGASEKGLHLSDEGPGSEDEHLVALELGRDLLKFTPDLDSGGELDLNFVACRFKLEQRDKTLHSGRWIDSG